MEKARLEELYNKELRSQLQQTLGLSNCMEIPKVSKIVLNVGVRDAVADNKVLQKVMTVVAKIAGQAPVKTLAKKSIAGFKLREGMPIGVKVTLRKKRMYEFLDKLISLALPKVRDFQGVPSKFDGRGSYNLGVKEWIIFPEIDYEVTDKLYGMNITIQTTAKNDQQGYELLKSFGMPFRKA
ncbi:MAG: 50S ribosomal protein L5 [Candidatus Dependentiae bacterium]|nr:50S ribosomal protein L5 [Candidatus Dependentiae bacterium]